LVLKNLTLSYRKLIKAAQYGTGSTPLLFCHPRGLGTRPRDVDSLLGGASEANLVTRSRPSSPLMTRQKSGIPSTVLYQHHTTLVIRTRQDVAVCLLVHSNNGVAPHANAQARCRYHSSIQYPYYATPGQVQMRRIIV
jgi:hypothetical protein